MERNIFNFCFLFVSSNSSFNYFNCFITNTFLSVLLIEEKNEEMSPLSQQLVFLFYYLLAKVDVQEINSEFSLCIIRNITVVHFSISDLQQQQGSLCGSVNLPLGLRTHQIQVLSGFSAKKNYPPNLCRQSFSNSRFQKQANAGSLFQRKQDVAFGN